jgi:hypothetical protein
MPGRNIACLQIPFESLVIRFRVGGSETLEHNALHPASDRSSHNRRTLPLTGTENHLQPIGRNSHASAFLIPDVPERGVMAADMQ